MHMYDIVPALAKAQEKKTLTHIHTNVMDKIVISSGQGVFLRRISSARKLYMFRVSPVHSCSVVPEAETNKNSWSLEFS